MGEASYEDIESDSIYWPGILKEVPRSKDFLSPVYEALTNSLEALKPYDTYQGEKSVIAEFHFQPGLFDDDRDLVSVVISDTGSGFGSASFDRIKKYRDSRKGFANRGTGRIQFLHFFGQAHFESRYSEGGSRFHRKFSICADTLERNVLISQHQHSMVSLEGNWTPGTSLTLQEVLDERVSRYFGRLHIEDLVERIRSHYILELVTNRDSLPDIRIRYILSGETEAVRSLSRETIPSPDKTIPMVFEYLSYQPEKKDFDKTGETESVQMTVFKIDPAQSKKNEARIVSKGQIASQTSFNLKSLPPFEAIGNFRFLVLLSSQYFDGQDGDARGMVALKRASELRKELIDDQLALDERFLDLDQIETLANRTLSDNYPEIEAVTVNRKAQLQRLKEMFLLDETVLSSVNPNDSEEKILEKVYASDSRLLAQRDAEIKKNLDSLGGIDPTAPNYLQILSDYASRVVRVLPLQSKTALSHYVARRRLVLELFQKALDHTLAMQAQGNRNIDEKILHNIIFQQHSTNPGASDLWLLSEEYVFFRGASESTLADIKVSGVSLLRENFTEEELGHLNSLGENRVLKRPDILLFPQEGKCMIIELKNPNANLSDHLNEINRYASLIIGFSRPEFQIRTFYGYLIGEGLDPDDVTDQDNDFIEAPSFGYAFRPYKRVTSKFSKSGEVGGLYTEVISYSSLLARAKTRNQMFIDRLFGEPPKEG